MSQDIIKMLETMSRADVDKFIRQAQKVSDEKAKPSALSTNHKVVKEISEIVKGVCSDEKINSDAVIRALIKRLRLSKVFVEVEAFDSYYQHPADVKIAWSGTGKMPAWLKSLEQAGNDIEQYRVHANPDKQSPEQREKPAKTSVDSTPGADAEDSAPNAGEGESQAQTPQFPHAVGQ